MSKIVYEEFLSEEDQLLAEYLAAASTYRKLAAEFQQILGSGMPADMTALDAAGKRLADIESNETFIRSQMRSLNDAARALGYSRAQMSKICREYGPGGKKQVRSERRGRDWYVCIDDIKYLIDTGELRGPYRKDR